MSDPPPPPMPQAWGRLERILLQAVKPSDHVELVRSEHRFGRLESVCDVVLDAGYISRRHCSIVLDSMDSQTNEPVAYLVSNSVHDVFVNKEAVHKGKRVPLREGSMIHFTQPGARQPHAYRLHILREGLTPENRRLRKQLKEWLDLTSSQAKTRKRLRAEASDTQGSANESDGMPVAARTRSQPERKRQRRESSEPEPAFVTQDENTDSSNFGMVLRSKTPSPGSKAAGKRRRRSGPEEEEETQESLQGLAPEDLQLNHENRIQKQQISSLQRELEKLKDALHEREQSEKQAREQTVVAQEAAKAALEEARMAREDAESSRVALAVATAQHTKEVDEMVYTQHELERNVARLEGKLRTCQSDRNREILQMDSQLKKKDSRIMSLEARVNELQQRTQDVVSSSTMSTSRTEAFKRQKVVLITQTVNELANPPTGMDSQEGSEESPSLIGNRRVSQDSNAENEASPDTPERQFSGGPARPVDVPIHVMAQMGDESKLGSSQELSQSQLTQSQSQSQLTPPQSQNVPAQPTSVITNPYRGRSTRRVLTTSPDEEVKRQQ